MKGSKEGEGVCPDLYETPLCIVGPISDMCWSGGQCVDTHMFDNSANWGQTQVVTRLIVNPWTAAAADAADDVVADAFVIVRYRFMHGR